MSTRLSLTPLTEGLLSTSMLDGFPFKKPLIEYFKCLLQAEHTLDRKILLKLYVRLRKLYDDPMFDVFSGYHTCLQSFSPAR